MGKKLKVSFAINLLVSAFFAALTFAQVDPEKALIGTWRSPETTTRVVIDSIKATGNDEWVASASQRNDRNIEIAIWKKDNEIYLRWMNRKNRAFRLKMTSDDKMEGTVAGFQVAHGISGTPGRWVEGRKVTFQRVKAGDVK